MSIQVEAQLRLEKHSSFENRNKNQRKPGDWGQNELRGGQGSGHGDLVGHTEGLGPGDNSTEEPSKGL